MKKLRVLVFSLLLAGIVILQSGCASYAAYSYNKSTAYGAAARGINTEQAIRAYANGDYIAIGVDLAATDVILQDWRSLGLQLGGAIVDGITLWAAIDAIDDMRDDDKPNPKPVVEPDPVSVPQGQTAQGDNTSITVNGDGNSVEYTINIGQE